MISSLEVKRFKSIEHLKLDCRRVNIFIGKPNTGKSNILESVRVFAFPYGSALKDFLRFENMTNLFCDQDLDDRVEIVAGVYSFEIKFENGRFLGQGVKEGKDWLSFDFGYDGSRGAFQWPSEPSPFKFYRFGTLNTFPRHEPDFLLPPRGENLLSILQTNKAMRKIAADIFSEYGLKNSPETSRKQDRNSKRS